jgi:hypothetical protein
MQRPYHDPTSLLVRTPTLTFFHLLLAGLVGLKIITSSVALLCPLELFRVVLSDGAYILVCDATCIPLHALVIWAEFFHSYN